MIEHIPGSINPGDANCLNFLVRETNPKNVLEIGTNHGGSTFAMISAMSKKSKLTTVDIKKCEAARDRLQVYSNIEFVQKPSFSYLCEAKRLSNFYDFIFIDGGHKVGDVYSDIYLSYDRLIAGGIIILHDYFPEAKPLWSNGKVIEGPWQAANMLKSEFTNLGIYIDFIPLGEIPWKTKCDSSITSLAIVKTEHNSELVEELLWKLKNF